MDQAQVNTDQDMDLVMDQEWNLAMDLDTDQDQGMDLAWDLEVDMVLHN